MNVVLWIVQLALAVVYFAGGAYKTFMFDDLASQMRTLPRGGWGAIGVFEMMAAVLLVVPAVARRSAVLTPIAAAALAVETLALAGVYAGYSVQLTAANPLVWALAMGLLAAFVAYGRYAMSPVS